MTQLSHETQRTSLRHFPLAGFRNTSLALLHFATAVKYWSAFSPVNHPFANQDHKAFLTREIPPMLVRHVLSPTQHFPEPLVTLLCQARATFSTDSLSHISTPAFSWGLMRGLFPTRTHLTFPSPLNIPAAKALCISCSILSGLSNSDPLDLMSCWCS